MPTITEKIIEASVEVMWSWGKPIAIRIDQTLTQDATGTILFLQLIADGGSGQTDPSISYVDHNTLQSGFETPMIKQIFTDGGKCVKHAVRFSPPVTDPPPGSSGALAKPQATLWGSAIPMPIRPWSKMGALLLEPANLDVACAMVGMPFWFNMPHIINVRLRFSPDKGVSSKDTILPVLQIIM